MQAASIDLLMTSCKKASAIWALLTMVLWLGYGSYYGSLDVDILNREIELGLLASFISLCYLVVLHNLSAKAFLILSK